jgi:hypothetical protein
MGLTYIKLMGCLIPDICHEVVRVGVLEVRELAMPGRIPEFCAELGVTRVEWSGGYGNV